MAQGMAGSMGIAWAMALSAGLAGGASVRLGPGDA